MQFNSLKTQLHYMANKKQQLPACISLPPANHFKIKLSGSVGIHFHFWHKLRLVVV